MVILGIIFCCIVVAVIYQWRTYRWRIVLFKYINGRYRPINLHHPYKAKTIKFTPQGNHALWVRKTKRFETAYNNKLIGKSTYFFAETPDGDWVNVDIGDLDTRKGILDIEPVFSSVKYTHEGINMNAENRYNKKSWLEEYGVMFLLAVVIVMLLVGMYINFAKLGKTADKFTIVGDRLDLSIQQQNKIVETLNKISTGGTGLIPAGTS